MATILTEHRNSKCPRLLDLFCKERQGNIGDAEGSELQEMIETDPVAMRFYYELQVAFYWVDPAAPRPGLFI